MIMKVKPLPDRDWLAARLDYNPETGDLVWESRPLEDFEIERSWKRWNTMHANKLAGCLKDQGYIVVRVDGEDYRAHRLAFYLATGEQPDMLDHRDGDRANNRLDNLRECTNTENLRNRRKVLSASGLRGVSWDRQRQKWLAHIQINGRFKNLGRYHDKQEAAKAAKQARLVHFGEFAGVSE